MKAYSFDGILTLQCFYNGTDFPSAMNRFRVCCLMALISSSAFYFYTQVVTVQGF